MTKKNPVFGYIAVSLLALLVLYLVLFFATAGRPVPFEGESAIGIEGGLAKLAFVIFAGLAALILATISAIIGLIRNEKRRYRWSH